MFCYFAGKKNILLKNDKIKAEFLPFLKKKNKDTLVVVTENKKIKKHVHRLPYNR